MRRYDELSRGAERSSPCQFFPDCTIAMCGYDFREGQGPGAAGWTHPPGTRPFNAGDAEAEFVSLEEADAEAQGKMTADGDVIGGAEEAEEEAEEEVELEDAGLNDAAFIEEQEEGDEDVTDIIGDVDDKEET